MRVERECADYIINNFVWNEKPKFKTKKIANDNLGLIKNRYNCLNFSNQLVAKITY